MNSNEQTPPIIAEGIISKLSPFSVEETLARLQEGIRQRGIKLFAHVNHSAEAEQAGLHMQEAHVLIFGNPKGGTPLMVASPLLALDLPLKVLVWQSNDGRVWASYTSTAFLAARYSLPKELTKNIAVIDGIVGSAIEA